MKNLELFISDIFMSIEKKIAKLFSDFYVGFLLPDKSIFYLKGDFFFNL